MAGTGSIRKGIGINSRRIRVVQNGLQFIPVRQTPVCMSGKGETFAIGNCFFPPSFCSSLLLPHQTWCCIRNRAIAIIHKYREGRLYTTHGSNIVTIRLVVVDVAAGIDVAKVEIHEPRNVPVAGVRSKGPIPGRRPIVGRVSIGKIIRIHSAAVCPAVHNRREFLYWRNPPVGKTTKLSWVQLTNKNVLSILPSVCIVAVMNVSVTCLYLPN